MDINNTDRNYRGVIISAIAIWKSPELGKVFTYIHTSEYPCEPWNRNEVIQKHFDYTKSYLVSSNHNIEEFIKDNSIKIRYHMTEMVCEDFYSNKVKYSRDTIWDWRHRKRELHSTGFDKVLRSVVSNG